VISEDRGGRTGHDILRSRLHVCDSTSSGEGESLRDELYMTEVSD
jgi:hypothetical protein